jgi:hypothetical protein
VGLEVGGYMEKVSPEIDPIGDVDTELTYGRRSIDRNSVGLRQGKRAIIRNVL